jgi:hypothetical protein
MQGGRDMRLTNKKVFLYIFIIAVIVLLMVPFFRMLSGVMVGEESYYHAQMAGRILREGIPEIDSLAARPYFFQPYHLVLAGFSFIFGIGLASFMVPFLCGLGSVVFFYKILRQFNFRPRKIFLIMAIYVLSPIFIWIFSTSNNHCAALFLVVLGVYLFLKEQKTCFIAAAVMLGLAGLFSIFALIFSLAVLIAYCARKKEHMKRFYIVLGVAVLALLFYLRLALYFGLPALEHITLRGVLIKYLSDIGGILGYGIFNILLALLGLYFIWKKGKITLAYILFFVLVIVSFYFNAMNAYLNLVFALFAGTGLYGLTRMKWHLKLIKKLTIIVLVAGLLFSTISYIGRIDAMQPDEGVINSLTWLRENSEPGEIVFSHYSNGFWIEAVAGRPVVVDSLYPYTPEFKARINDSEKIFESRNLVRTKELLDLYNVSYIWIDGEMAAGQVWSKEEEGLLFLFRNEETFDKIYDTEGILIYEYIGG